MSRIMFFTILGLCVTVLAQDKGYDPFAPNAKLPPPGTHKESEPIKRDIRPTDEMLKFFGEPALKARQDAAEFPAIRLIWVRTFHAPISLRAYQTKEGPRLRVARSSGKGGYNWGELNFENDFPLGPTKWDELAKLLAVEGARQPLKNVKPDDRDFLSGLDGATWTLEVSDKDGYTVEKVWSPTSVAELKADERKLLESKGFRLDSFVKLCKFLIQYAPIDTETIY